MISHYCNQNNSPESPEKKEPTPNKEFNSAGKMSYTDQITTTSTIDQSVKHPVINVRSLVAEQQIRSHLILDEFLKSIRVDMQPVQKKLKIY